MSRPEILGPPVENSKARYWPLSSGRPGGAPVTVREGERIICLTDLHDLDCPHIRVVRDHIEQTAAAERAARSAA